MSRSSDRPFATTPPKSDDGSGPSSAPSVWLGDAATLEASRPQTSTEVLPLATVADAPSPGADFQVGETLGVGGMGHVLSARQTAIDREVALKFLRDPARDPVGLVREAIVTGRLEHPNIVPVHLLARTQAGETFFSMKRVEGTSWSRTLEKGQPLVEALEVLLRVCDTVAFAHSRGVLHRDIKPANVLLGSFGEVYLVDWGIAVSLAPDTVLPLASEARPAGTPNYAAPEMLGGGGQLSERSDIFLLGATLHEVLAGRPPYSGNTPEEAMQAAVAAARPTLPADTPQELADICRRAMAPQPADRYASVAELRTAVAGYLRHREALALFQQAKARLVDLEALVARRLADVESTESGPAMQSAFDECRFGLEQVQRGWPDFEPARQAMQQCLLLRVEYEVLRGDARAAGAFLMQTTSPPAELVATVEALEARERGRAERLASLEHDAKERELDVVLDAKRSFAFGFAALVLAGAVLATAFIPELLMGPTTGVLVLAFSAPLASSALLRARVRRHREQNDAQLRLSNALRASAWSTMGLWVTAWYLQVPANHALAFNLVVAASNWGIGAIIFYRRARVLVVAQVLAALAVLALPRYAFLAAGVCVCGGFIVLGLNERAKPRR